MQHDMHAQYNARQEVAERAEVARHVSLYQAREEDLNRKMHELEVAEAAVVEAFTRQKDATSAQRIVVNRKLELLQQATSASVPPLGHFLISVDRTSLPPHLQDPSPPSSLGLSMISNLTAGNAAVESMTPANAAPKVGMIRPGETNQEGSCPSPSPTLPQ